LFGLELPLFATLGEVGDAILVALDGGLEVLVLAFPVIQ
jgi:hypothetical protein